MGRKIPGRTNDEQIRIGIKTTQTGAFFGLLSPKIVRTKSHDPLQNNQLGIRVGWCGRKRVH